MNAGFQKETIQRALGVKPDRIFGSKTLAAFQRLGDTPNDAPWPPSTPTITQPNAAPAAWPADTEAALRDFYGPPGESRLVMFDLPYPMRIAWDTDTTVTRSRCHEVVRPSLVRVFASILAHYGSLSAVREARMDLFGGIYNYRQMRGGSSWSRHAWGIAIDLDPDRNDLNTPWPGKATMPEAVVKLFEAEGWKSGGRAWGRDAMHFQATR